MVGMARTGTTTKTAIYLRQSKDSNDDKLAVSRQRDGCAKLCAERKWTNTAEYKDNDRSATNGTLREDYQRLLTDIAAGTIGRVVVWDLDRLHRQPIELEHFMRLADEHRVGLATVTGDVDLATDNGRLFARIKGAVGIAEVERKTARQKAAMVQLATPGEDGARAWWPHRPFGYDADRDPVTGKWWTYKKASPPIHNEIRLHPTEAALIAQAYEDVVIGTVALREIAKRWNDAGVTTPMGNRWVGVQVRNLLLAARNAGLREYRGEVVGKGAWPAIVDEGTWRDAVALLSDPKRNKKGIGRGRKYLLSGLATCGLCGAPMSSAFSHRNGHRSYQCYRVGCQKIGRDGARLDELITETVVRRLSQPDAVQLLVTDEDEVDVPALHEKRRLLEDRLEQLGTQFGDGDLPAATLRSATARITAQLAEIEDALPQPGKARVFVGVIGAKDVRKAFDGLDLDRKRAIIDALMTITVQPVGRGTGRVFDPQYIDVEWKA